MGRIFGLVVPSAMASRAESQLLFDVGFQRVDRDRMEGGDSIDRVTSGLVYTCGVSLMRGSIGRDRVWCSYKESIGSQLCASQSLLRAHSVTLAYSRCSFRVNAEVRCNIQTHQSAAFLWPSETAVYSQYASSLERHIWHAEQVRILQNQVQAPNCEKTMVLLNMRGPLNRP